MSFKKDFRQLLKPYYWVNIILCLSYIVCKKTMFICHRMFPSDHCELDSRESEILFFLIIVIMMRTRKAGSVTMVNYLSASFVYTKIANLFLWFYSDVRYGMPYGALIILLAILLPEPTYMGPENVIYFHGLQSLEDEIKKKQNTWLICLYTAWHPACVNFAPVFAELSASYALENFKFGKIDMGRYPEVAAKYRIQEGPTSRQMPTVLLVKDGVETMRRPHADHNGRLQKFLFSKDNVKAAFDLDGIYEECKKQLSVRAIKNKDEKTAQKKTQ